MTSRMKWLLLGPLMVTIGLLLFWLWYVLKGPIVVPIFLFADCFFAGGVGMWGYGWTEKVKVFGGIANWLNRDGVK